MQIHPSYAPPLGFSTSCVSVASSSLLNAKTDLQWIPDYSSWKSLRDSGGAERDKYFVKKWAYGNPQKQRSIDIIDNHYKDVITSNHLSWPQFINGNPSARQTFDYFQLFYNIGALSALLIVGDLAQAGITDFPSLKEMAALIKDVDRGAMRGLESLGLL
jgi:hypothetical protein